MDAPISQLRVATTPAGRIGWIVRVGLDGEPVVDYDGNAGPPMAARVFAAVDATALREAVTDRRAVALMFVDGDPRRPLLLGIEARPSPVPRTLELRASESLRIECGESSIMLTGDGRVVVRGLHVETRARGINRIKGGAVRIN
jgi:hypothetical protein